MNRECKICKTTEKIVWNDWCKGIGGISLCYECYVFCYPDEKSRFTQCPRCKNPYMPKEDWQKICTNCWIEEVNGED